ncbi:MAG: nucleotide exchange factor GrpE [Clostridia bacterium]|nr:nucleotide exchange factor GrpE [Clostridiales bacterium]
MEDKDKDLKEKEQETGERNGKEQGKSRECSSKGSDGDTEAAGKGLDGEAAEGQTVQGQLEELKEKNEEYYNRLLRLQADFDNYRKRIAREKEEMYGYVAGEIILDFLGVLDNMERAALSAAGQDCDCGSASLREGIEMVVKQLREILSKYHVEEIPAEGEKFDPNFHHAVMQVKDTDKEEGTVLEVLQKGYMIKTRVLRPSIVKVAL